MSYPTPDDFAADLIECASYELLHRVQSGTIPFGWLVMYFRVLREFALQIFKAANNVPEADRDEWISRTELAYLAEAETFMAARLDHMRKLAPQGKKVIREFRRSMLPLACHVELFPESALMEQPRREALHRAMEGLSQLAGLAPPETSVAFLRRHINHHPQH